LSTQNYQHVILYKQIAPVTPFTSASPLVDIHTLWQYLSFLSKCLARRLVCTNMRL